MMNKMGVWQRSWCILVTFALLVALSFIYTKAGREADREYRFPPVQAEAASAPIFHAGSAAQAFDSGGAGRELSCSALRYFRINHRSSSLRPNAPRH